MLALFINAAILIVSAATFHQTAIHEVAEIQEAYKLLIRRLASRSLDHLRRRSAGPPTEFQLTGTLAGQIVMEGFLNIRLRPGSVA